jgi:uncharacterized membrane protein YdjX (TVP38/TMEM64 family)
MIILTCNASCSPFHISLLVLLPVILMHLQVVLFVLPYPLLHLLGGNILLHATVVGTTTRTPG